MCGDGYITIPKSWYEELLRVYVESAKRDSQKLTPADTLPIIPDPCPKRGYDSPKIGDYPFPPIVWC